MCLSMNTNFYLSSYDNMLLQYFTCDLLWLSWTEGVLIYSTKKAIK